MQKDPQKGTNNRSRSSPRASPCGLEPATGEPPDGERTIGIAFLGLVVVTVAFDAGRACPPESRWHSRQVATDGSSTSAVRVLSGAL